MADVTERIRAGVVDAPGSEPRLGSWSLGPRPPGTTLVEVVAAPVNPLDLLIASGTFHSARHESPYVPGSECVGVVLDSDIHLPGSLVYGECHATPTTPGAFATRVLIPDDDLLALPAGLDPVLAAAVGNSGVAAYLPLVTVAELRPGETVLVLGATGAVGQLAIQVARHRDAGRVVGVARNRVALDQLLDLGADAVLDLRAGEDVAALAVRLQAAAGPVDVVLDGLFGAPLEAALQACAPHARVVNIGNLAGTTAQLPAGLLRGKQLSLTGFAGLHTPLQAKSAALTWLWTALAKGELRIEVATFTLEELPAAWRAQGSSPHAKCVVLPGAVDRHVDHDQPRSPDMKSHPGMSTAHTDHKDTKVLTGVFAGPVCGLRYETPTRSGLTNERGEFHYRTGETITFLVGGLVLGAVDGAPRVTVAHLANRADGKMDRVHDPIVTNLARLVQTLDRDGGTEGPVTVAPVAHELVGAMVLNFNQATTDAAQVQDVAETGASGGSRMVAFAGDQSVTFAGDPMVTRLLATLDEAPGVFTANTPRTLCDGAAARNKLRRDLRGIVKTTDVRIPLRDGSYVCADVFCPADDGQYPVVMNQGFYGKSFGHGCIGSAEEAKQKEELEDRYFSGNPDGLQYENHESVDSSVWVPNGYVCIRVDARGVGHSPGLQAPFSVQQAQDYYDAIEWAGTQPWSNGNVGLWGMSYLAITQHAVASLRPPHLKAMVALGTDADLYNEAFYGGGLFGEGFWTWWRAAMAGHNYHGERRETDWLPRLLATPFDDPDAYGPHGSIFMRPDIDQATAPVWIVGPQTGVVIHQAGSSETFIRSTGVTAKKFDFIDAWFPHSYKQSTIADHLRYFDYWLKGIDNGAMDGPPVRVQVRTGNGGSFVLEDSEWPLPSTTYRRWYLDATPSDWSGDGLRTDFLRVREDVPATESSVGYDAHLDIGRRVMAPVGVVGGTPRWSTGVSFVSDPMTQEMVLAGYMKVGLWVSSTSSDMDVFVSLRVLDENDREVRYESLVPPVDPTNIHPVGHGLLKVSHRAIDESRSRAYWPVHTHAEADYRPLPDGEIVAVEVGLNPSTARIRKGFRLRVDVQPFSPAGIPARAYDESYHVGAHNVVYTGPDHPSYIQLPIVPQATVRTSDPGARE